MGLLYVLISYQFNPRDRLGINLTITGVAIALALVVFFLHLKAPTQTSREKM